MLFRSRAGNRKKRRNSFRRGSEAGGDVLKRVAVLGDVDFSFAPGKVQIGERRCGWRNGRFALSEMFRAGNEEGIVRDGRQVNRLRGNTQVGGKNVPRRSCWAWNGGRRVERDNRDRGFGRRNRIGRNRGRSGRARRQGRARAVRDRRRGPRLVEGPFGFPADFREFIANCRLRQAFGLYRDFGDMASGGTRALVKWGFS